jgi:hypothetical protein
MRRNLDRFYILVAIMVALLIALCFVPNAYGMDKNYLEIDCGQEYVLVEREDGYKVYEAWFTWVDTWRGLELTSAKVKYWNGVKTINSKVGFSDIRENMFSPLTCEQITGKKFGAFISIPEEEEVNPIVVENKKLKEENSLLEKTLNELQEQVASIMEVLNKLTK